VDAVQDVDLMGRQNFGDGQVGDGDTMSVVAEIAHDMFWPTERPR